MGKKGVVWGMKVLERAITPNGVKIQIEDWSEDYSFHRFADVVAAYPMTIYGKKEFRAEQQFKNATEASDAFYSLKNGEKNLDDFNFTAKSIGKDVPYKQYIPLSERYFERW